MILQWSVGISEYQYHSFWLELQHTWVTTLRRFTMGTLL